MRSRSSHSYRKTVIVTGVILSVIRVGIFWLMMYLEQGHQATVSYLPLVLLQIPEIFVPDFHVGEKVGFFFGSILYNGLLIIGSFLWALMLVSLFKSGRIKKRVN
jgi:hypothetical protein